jgi:hypothetical protein
MLPSIKNQNDAQIQDERQNVLIVLANLNFLVNFFWIDSIRLTVHFFLKIQNGRKI